MANNIASYLRNVGKSVQYATADVFKEKFESTSSFVDANQELFKELYGYAKDYKKTIDKAGQAFQASKIYQAGDQYFANLKEDIKTGKWYNKEREDSMYSKAMGSLGDFSGMDMDIESFDFDSDDEVVAKPKLSHDGVSITGAIQASARVSSEAISGSVVQSADYLAKTQKANAKAAFAQGAQMIQSINNGFATMTSGLGTINANLETVSIHAENSRKFFESTSGKLDVMTQLLKEINERQAKMYGAQQQESSKTAKTTYGDITDSNGMPDIKAYMANIQKNIKTAMGPSGDMLFGDTFGEGSNMLMAFVTSPMAFLPKLLINSILPKGLDKAAKSLDKTVSGFFGNAIAQFNKMAKGDNGILKTIGEIFGIKSNIKSTIDTSKYQKGPVPFDGIVRKSIIEVIPGHLRRIEKLLGSKEERFFDFDSGKWITSKDIDTKYKAIKQNKVKDSFSEAMPYFKEMFDSVRPEQKKQYDELMKNFGEVLEGIYDNYGAFRFNDKRTVDQYAEYGAQSESQMQMIMKMFQQLPHDISTQIANRVLNNRTGQNREMEKLESDSYSPLIHKFDNSINQRDLDRAQALASGKNVYGSEKYAPYNLLMESRDEKGYNIFNYLRNMLSELMLIRDNTTDLPKGGPGGGNRGGRRRPGGGGGPSSNPDLKDENGKLKVQDIIPIRKSKEDQEADKIKKKEQDSYSRRREHDILKGKSIDINIQSGANLDEDELASTRGMFEILTARRDREDAKNATETETWFQKWIGENAAKAEKNGTNGEKLSLFDQLTQAENISKKWEVVKNNFARLVEKPGQAFVSVIQGADKRLYELMFGYNTGTGIDGKPIKGFIGFTTDQIKRSFQKLNDWVDDSLSKLKDKLGIDSFGELFTKLLDKIGLNEDRRNAIKDKVKDVLRPYSDSIKNTFSGAWQGTKNAVIDTVSPAVNRIRGPISNEDLQSKYDRSAQAEDIPFEQILANIRPSDIGAFSGNGVIYNTDGTIITQEQREEMKKKLGPGGRVIKTTGQSEIQKRIKLAAQEANTSNDAMDQAYIDWNYLSEEEKSKTTIGKFIKDRAAAIVEAEKAKREKQEKEAKAKNSIKNAADKARAEIEENADGSRYITKTGLTAISEGEMIIPADMNPFNPNRNKVNRGKQLQKEKSVANGFISNIVSSLSKNIHFNADGIDNTTGQLNGEVVDATEHKGDQKAGEFIGQVKDEGKQIGKEIKDATVRIIYGDEKKSNEALKGALKDVTAHIKEYAPDTVSHGLLGGLIGTGVSLLTGVVGGPLLGAATGAAIGLVKKSSGLQNWLFGEIDEETGERKGGVFSKKLQTNFKKYFPTMKNYGITGALAGILTPLGPIGGLMIGSAVGFLRKNEKFSSYLFGDINEETGEREDNGLIKKKAQDFIKKSMPRAAIGATAAMFIGPFGLLGNAALGAGIGMLTSTDKFKDAVFGKVNEETGEREGGVVGAIHTGIVEPLKGAFIEFKDEFKTFMHDKVMDPLARFIEPVGQDIKNMFKDIGNSVSTFMNNRFEKSLGIPLEAFVKQRFFDPLGKFFKNITGGFMAPFKAVVSAPFKMLRAYGDSRRRSQIKSGKATDMTADERMAFMRERPGILGKIFNKDGDYKLKGFDEIIANADSSNLNEMEELLTDLVGGKGAFEQKIGTEKHQMSGEVTEFIKKNKLDSTIKYSQLKDILEAASAGDLDKARVLLQKRGLNGKRLEIDDQNEIFEMIKARSETLQKLQARKENAGREKSSLYKDLEAMGLKGINEKNQRWFLDNISTEAKARAKSGDINPENAADPVLAKIQENSIKAANENAQNIINKLNDIKNVFAYFTGVDENGNEVKRPMKGKKGIYVGGLTAGDLTSINNNLEQGQMRDQKINDKDRAKVAGVKKSFGNIYDINALEEQGAVFSANTAFGVGGRGQKMVNLHNTEGSADIKQDAVVTALAIDDATWGLVVTIQTAGYALSSDEILELGKFTKVQRLNVYAILKPNSKNRSFYYRNIRDFNDIKTISKLSKEMLSRVQKLILVGWNDRNIDQLLNMSKDIKQLNSAIHGPDRTFNPATGKIEESEASKRVKQSDSAPNASDDGSQIVNEDNNPNPDGISSGTTKTKTKRSFVDTIFGRKYVEVNNKGEVATADDAESKEVESAQKNFRAMFAGKASKVPLIGKWLSNLINPTGKEQSSKKDSDEEEDNEGGFISKILKSKAFKVIGGIVGGVTAVAATGHIGKWWDEKAWPSIKNFLAEHPIGEKIVNAITNFRDWLGEKFTNGISWITGTGKYTGAGFPYFWREGIIPWYVEGIGYFLENIVPGAVNLLVKALPTIIGSAMKGLAKIFSTSITSLFGHKKLSNVNNNGTTVEDPTISFGQAWRNSFGGTSGGTMSSPRSNWLKSNFGYASNYGKISGDMSYGIGGMGDGPITTKSGLESVYDPTTGLTGYRYTAPDGSSMTPGEAYNNGYLSAEEYYQFLINSGMSEEDAYNMLNAAQQAGIFDENGQYTGKVVGKDQSIGGAAISGLLRAPFAAKSATRGVKSFGKFLGHIPGFKTIGRGIQGYANLADNAARGAANISARAGTRVANAAAGSVDDILTRASSKITSVIGASDDLVLRSNNRIARRAGTAIDSAAVVAERLGVSKKAAEEILKMGNGVKGVDALMNASDEVIEGAAKLAGTSKDALKNTLSRAAGHTDDIVQASTGILSKIQTKLDKMFETGGWLTKQIAKIGKKITGKSIAITTKLANTAGGKIVKGIMGALKKAGAKALSALSKAIPVLNVVFIATDFISGYDNAAGILGIKSEEVNFWHRLLCGLVKAVNGFFALGIIPESTLVDIFIDVLAPLFGIDTSEIEAQRAEAEARVIAWNQAHPDEMYDSVYAFETKDNWTTKVTKAVGGFFGGIADGAKNAWNWITGKGNEVSNAAKTAGSAAADAVYNAGATVSNKVAQQNAIRQGNASIPSNIANNPNIYQAFDPATGMPVYIDGSTGMSYNADGSPYMGAVGGMGDGLEAGYSNDQYIGTNPATGVYIDVADIASKASVSEESKENIANSINELLDSTMYNWNNNIQALVDMVSDTNFVKTEDVFTEEFKTNVKDSTIKNIQDSVYNAWMVANALAMDQWQQIFGMDDQYKSNMNMALTGTGALTGAAIGTALLPGVGTLIGAGVGGLVGWFTGKLGGEAYDASKIEKDSVKAIGDLSGTMIDLYNDQLKTSVDWLNEAADDISKALEDNQKDKLIELAKDKVTSAIENAWTIACELALAQWQTVFNYEDTMKSNISTAATAGGAGVGAAIGTVILPGIGTLIGAGIGALTGWFASKAGENIYDMSQVEEDTVSAIGTLSESMINLYNSKLTSSVKWIDEITKSNDLLTTSHKATMIETVKENLADAITSAWAVAESLSQAEWNKALGLDMGFNIWSLFTKAAAGGAIGAGAGAIIGGGLLSVPGAIIGGGIGVFGALWDDIEKSTQIDNGAEASIITLKTSMSNLYNSKLVHTTKWIDELLNTSDMMTTSHKQMMIDGVKENLVEAIGKAWAVAEELSQAEWNKALGLNMGFNFWQSFKNIASAGIVGASVGGVGAGVASGGLLAIPGAIIGGGVGIFGAIWNQIDKANQIDNGAETSINTLIDKMSLLYNTKLTATTSWLDEMMSSSDMMTTDHKQTMVNLTRENLVKAIGSAWATAEELSVAKWNKALGLDPSYNFWNGTKDFISDAANTTADNAGLMLIPVIGPALAAGSGIIGAIWNKFVSSNTIDTNTETAINNLTSSMNNVYMNGLAQSQGWLDEIVKDDSFMTESDKAILRGETRKNLRIAISSAWVTASELAKSKWNKALGLDPSYNFLKGAKNVVNIIGDSLDKGESIIGNLWKAFTDSLKPDEEVQESIDTLTNSMKTTWNKNLVASLDIMKEEKTFDLSSEDKKLLIDNTRTKLTEMILTAWGVANDLTVKKFNKSLGLDPNFNFMNGLNNLITASDEAAKNESSVIGVLWKRYTENNVEDTEVSNTVDVLVGNMENLWVTKIGATKQFIEDAKIDDSFVKQRDKNDLVNIARDGLVEMLNTTWGVASDINIRKWKFASNYVSRQYGAIGYDIANSFGGYGTTTTTQLSDEEKEKYSSEITGVENIVTAIQDLWIHKLNTMLTLVNAGSAANIDIIPKENEDLWKPIDDGVADVSTFYNNNKLNLKDNKIDFKKYLSTGKPSENESFYGLKSMIYHDQKLYGLIPLTFNRITTEAAKEFKSFGKDITNGMNYANTITKTVSNEIAKVNQNTQFSKLFKEMNDKNPLKNIIYWMEKVISFPLYLSKYMTRKMEELGNNNSINGLFDTVDKVMKRMNNRNSFSGTGNWNLSGKGGGESGVSQDLSNDSGNPDYIINQVDPEISGITYNAPGDKLRQTIRDSGCAPVNAVNVVNSIYGDKTADIKKAVRFAIQKGYKESNGGTTIDYFPEFFNQYGINSEATTDPNEIVSNINEGKPVVLLGQDGKFGGTPHYMTVTGVDSFGNATVMNPDTRNKIDQYNIKDLLKYTQAATIVKGSDHIVAPKVSGFGKFKKYIGYGTQISDDKLISIAAEIISKSEGNYSSINKNDNGSMSIGKLQWNANAGRALPLLKRIVALNPEKAKSTLGNALYSEIANSANNAWNKAGRKCSDAEYTPLKTLLGSAEGIKGQNATIVADIPSYFSSIRNAGITDPGAMIYLADACNQFGTGTAVKWAKNAGAKTLAEVHNAIKSTCKAAYHKRRDKCYEMCVNWQEYNGIDMNDTISTLSATTTADTSSSSSSGDTIYDYLTSLGTNMVKKIYGEDTYNAVFGKTEGETSTSGVNASTLNGGVTVDKQGNVIATSVPRNGNIANNFPYYSQLEKPWADKPYGIYGTIESHGCGPTSMAMVANSYGITANPETVTNYLAQNGYTSRKGTYHAGIKAFFEKYGNKVLQTGDANTMYNNAKRGIPSVTGMSKGVFTSGGHLISIVGVDKDGKIIVNDPSSPNDRTNRTFDLSVFKREMGTSNIISNKDGIGSIGRVNLPTGFGSGTKTSNSWMPSGNGSGTINAPKLDLDTYTSKSNKQTTILETQSTDNSQIVRDRAYAEGASNSTQQINYAKFFISIIEILTKVSDNTNVLNAILSFLRENMNVNISSEEAKKLKNSSVAREAAKTNMRNQLNASGVRPVSAQTNTSAGVSKELQYIIDAMTNIAKE